MTTMTTSSFAPRTVIVARVTGPNDKRITYAEAS
ncbi:TetR family transcriptional regulator, partial [Mycobacterium sp. ITM-2017-0098]